MKNDDFGSRMKLYEGIEAKRMLMPLLPICVRVDGQCFHSFTRGCERPFDKTLREMMVETTLYLVEQTGACIGYTQSDEISIILYTDSLKSQVFFDGKIHKLVSIIASKTTAKFLSLVYERMSWKARLLPTFDCRVWTVPNQSEAANYLLWREADATKNSISMASSCYYSHKELEGKSGNERQEMLFSKGVNWNDYPDEFKRGVFVQRRTFLMPFSAEEVNCLPEKHAARLDPDMVVERSMVREVKMPSFRTVTNRVDVVFNGADPIVEHRKE